MTGAEIRQLRVALGMDAQKFAQVLQVHPTTLYRWELTIGEVRIEPFQAQLIELLRQQTSARTKPADLGKALLTALLLGGAIYALYKLLEGSFSDEPEDHGGDPNSPKRPTARVMPRSQKRGRR